MGSGLEEGILNILTKGSREAILTLGWMLYLYERYVLSPRREKEFRDDIAGFRQDYADLADKMSTALASFSTILEVVKDRIGRPS